MDVITNNESYVAREYNKNEVGMGISLDINVFINGWYICNDKYLLVTVFVQSDSLNYPKSIFILVHTGKMLDWLFI